MEAARAWNTPHSVFTGRRVVPGEPLWTAMDTALAVALHGLESVTCNGCGNDRRQTMDPDREYGWVAEAVRCHACATRDRAAEAYSKNGGSAAGLAYIVTEKKQEVVDGGG